MQEISTITTNLPQTIEGKTKYVLFGMEALKIYRAKLKAMEKAGISKEQYDQLKIEAQETAENLLLFSADIGKELEKVDKASGGDRRSENFKIDGNVKNEKTKPETIHEMGFTDRQARDFQTLAQHPEVVQQAIKDARENDRIVTRSDALKKIDEKKREEALKSWTPPIDPVKEAKERHSDFSTDNKTIDFKDAQQDREDREIIARETRGKIGRINLKILELAINEDTKAVEDIRLIELPGEIKTLVENTKKSISILSLIVEKLGG